MDRLITYSSPTVSDGFLLKEMAALGKAPWTEEQGLSADISYLQMWSGDKPTTRFTRRNSVNGQLNVPEVAAILWDIFGNSWTRLWEASLAKYVPINNYSILETTARTENTDRDITRNIDRTGTLDTTKDSTTKVDSVGNSTINYGRVLDSEGTSETEYGHIVDTTAQTDDFAYAFNSPQSAPTTVSKDTNTQTNSGKDTTNTIGKETSSGSDSTDTTGTENGTAKDTINQSTTDKSTDTTTDTTGQQEDITRNREGNIGQNTFQSLLAEEFELWKWNFWKQVFSDLDSFLVLAYFDPCGLVD